MEELTIGIEEEYQIIDPKTRELTSFISEFLDRGAMLFRDQLQPELLQSQVEVGTRVCKNIQEAREEIYRLRGALNKIAKESGKRIAAAGTHPFSSWKDQIVTDKERYKGFIDSMQYVARRLLIFGMHVHIGISDRDMQIDVMNQMSYFMPHILALSTSSPFFSGQKTGLKSYRSIVFEDLPRTGISERFETALEYDQYVKTLIKCGCIKEPTMIWWDMRPHPKFPTLEFRVCDCVTKVDEVIAIAALIQALVAKMIQLRHQNRTWRTYRRSLIAENKWRAAKDGIEGKLIDLGKEEEVPMKSLVEEMLDFIDDVVDSLGTRKEVEYVRTMLDEGNSADRQLRCYDKTGSIEAVTDMLIKETIEGC